MTLAYTTYLIDLDGVVYRGETLVNGAKEFIAWLDKTQKKYLFLTNNSFASETQVLQKLERLGVPSDSSHILGAGQAAVQNIAHRHPGATVYVIGEQPLLDMVHAYDLKVADIDAQTADVVLVGLDRAFSYKKLTSAVKAGNGRGAFCSDQSGCPPAHCRGSHSRHGDNGSSD